MGLRGPAPKPTEVRRLEGNPSHRPLPANEPYYPPGIPAKPTKISAAASAIWDELVDGMAVSAVLRRVDRRALWQLAEDEALLASAYEGIWSMAADIKRQAKDEAKARKAEAKAARPAPVQAGEPSQPATATKKRLPKGGEILMLLLEKDSRMAMNAVGHLAARVIIERREFGLTPSSRSRIEIAADGSAMDSLEMKLCG